MLSSNLVFIVVATSIVSLVSFVGTVSLSLKAEKLSAILVYLVALSAGTLMGGAFIHLLPESSTELGTNFLFITVLVSFIIFFLIEKILHWRHCHEGKCEVHTFGYTNLIGDVIHNFIDGLIIAASFNVDIELGIVTTLAVALHEIPQEIGDFGVLLYSGFSKERALAFNFLAAFPAVLGGITGYFWTFASDFSAIFLLPFAAGGFLYIATSDLLPEIREETDLKRSLTSFAIFIFGILIMYALTFLEAA